MNLNKILLSFLSELYQESKERRSQSAPIYRRAYRSLKSCPLQFQHPTELSQLAGISVVLVDELERRHETWCEEKGIQWPAKPVQPLTSSLSQGIDGNRKRGRRREIASQDDSDLSEDLSNRLSSSSSECESQTRKSSKSKEVASSKQKSKSSEDQRRREKLYIPQPRTGSYGILISLFSLTPEKPTSETSSVQYNHSKATIIQHAQSFCDSRYIPKQMPPSMNRGGAFNFNSAWSGMKTLINRGYVYRKGNPAKFVLSKKGWDVASTCAAKEGMQAGAGLDNQKDEVNEESRTSRYGDDLTARTKGRRASSKCYVGTQAKRDEADQSRTSPRHTTSDDSETLAKRITTGSSDPGPFLYTYLRDGPSFATTKWREQATARLSDRDYTMLRQIVFGKDQRDHPFVTACIEDVFEEKVEGSDVLIGYVRDSASNEKAPGMPILDTQGKDRLKSMTIAESARLNQRKEPCAQNVDDVASSSEVEIQSFRPALRSSEVNTLPSTTKSKSGKQAVYDQPLIASSEDSSDEHQGIDLGALIKNSQKNKKHKDEYVIF